MNRGVSEADIRRIVFDALDLSEELRAECTDSVTSALTAALAAEPGAAEGMVPRPEDEWHEDHGDVVWWTWKGDEWLGEPSYIGSPLDTAWPGYHTHWTPHPASPAAPQMSATEGLIERLKAATMGFDWADLPDDAAIPAVPLLREAAAELEALRSRCERMEEALAVAVDGLSLYEPGDSRAVSDLFVALASVVCKCDDAASWAIIDTASALQQGGKADESRPA